MKALSDRQSIRNFSENALPKKSVGSALGAANDINRRDSGKRTAPSPVNRQNVKICVCTKKASFLYDQKPTPWFP